MPNPTCRLLSNGYKFSVDINGRLSYRPCCIFKKSFVIYDKKEFDLKRSLVSGLNSHIHPFCNDCNFLEKQTLRTSQRELGFQVVPETANDGDPTFLELQISNTCNGGCIMCGPDASSFWASELKQLKPADKRNWIEQISSLVNLEKTKYIRIIGGEPMLMDIEKQLLDVIKDPSGIEIQLTTNASIYPSMQKINQWKQFKKVRLNFSIDGIKNRFEYIRHPLSWNIVEQNILRMQNELDEHVAMKINHTVNLLNLFYYDEFNKWANEKFVRGSYTFTPAAGILSPRQVPFKLRQLVVEKYGPESKPAKVIEKESKDCNDLLLFLNTLDTRRKLNWKNQFPEIVEYLQ